MLLKSLKGKGNNPRLYHNCIYFFPEGDCLEARDILRPYDYKAIIMSIYGALVTN